MTSLDTTPEAQRVQAAILRRMAPEERVEAAFSMSDEVRQIACAGIRAAHPDWDERRVRYEMLVRLYGAELVAEAWGTPPRA